MYRELSWLLFARRIEVFFLSHSDLNVILIAQSHSFTLVTEIDSSSDWLYLNI